MSGGKKTEPNDKTSIKLSGEVNAVTILTIHKAKGLQFKYVLIPFCSWNIDHEGFRAPLLWVSSDEQPYADAGPMPIKYGSILKNTYFNAPYEEERIKAYLDSLNLLYVALTRAELGMMITAPAPKTGPHATAVASWLYEAIQQSDDLNAAWSEATLELVIGELGKTKDKAASTPNALQLNDYPTSRWRDKLVIRQAGNPFFDGMNPETRKRISYGIYLHAVLSRIKTTEDVDPVLSKLVHEGTMTATERADLEPQLNTLLSDPEVSSWFKPNWDIRTEIPILVPGGSANRIDRLMIDGKKAVIVDFKTGEQAKADHAQVLAYIDILMQMGFTDVQGYLLYTRDKEVIAVNEGKGKVVRKKKGDDAQLGLGL